MSTKKALSICVCIVAASAFIIYTWPRLYYKLKLKDNCTSPTKIIYFHETSGKGLHNSRQACAVESAARAHPTWQINVFMLGRTSSMSFVKRHIEMLKEYENINFETINLEDYSKGTILEPMISEGVLQKSNFQIAHKSDALKYLSLFKWGGVALDLDVVVVKPFDNLACNFAAFQDNGIAVGALAFSDDYLGQELAKTALSEFEGIFKGTFWGTNGADLITRVLKQICSTTNVTEMSSTKCKGFEIYDQKLFYPARDPIRYFIESSKQTLDGKPQPYMHHIWDQLTAKEDVDESSFYVELAQTYCPNVYYTVGLNAEDDY